LPIHQPAIEQKTKNGPVARERVLPRQRSDWNVGHHGWFHPFGGRVVFSKTPEAFRAEGYAIDALTGSNDSA
jgi:hypothetical protein